MRKVCIILFFAVRAFAQPIAVEYQVDASADDAIQQVSNAVSITIAVSPLAHYTSNNARWGGIRFLNIQIPRGATIVSAAIVINDTTAGGTVIDATIFGEAADDPSTFTTTSSDISNRTRTSASVEWDVASTTTGEITSPSITTVIQEIVNRAGFVAGNDMAIIIQINANNTALVRSFNGNPTKAAKLQVSYAMRRRHKIMEF